jgi:hypothetical protein
VIECLDETEAAVNEFLLAANVIHSTDERLGKRALVAIKLQDAAAGQDDPATTVLSEHATAVQRLLEFVHHLIVGGRRIDRCHDAANLGGEFVGLPTLIGGNDKFRHAIPIRVQPGREFVRRRPGCERCDMHLTQSYN